MGHTVIFRTILFKQILYFFVLRKKRIEKYVRMYMTIFLIQNQKMVQIKK